jgi:hypothetical protein
MYDGVNAILDKDVAVWKLEKGGITVDLMRSVRAARGESPGTDDGFFLHLRQGEMYVSRTLQGGNSRTAALMLWMYTILKPISHTLPVRVCH